MRIRREGQIAEGLWCLGREESCIYLLRGNGQSILINGGMSYLVEDLEGQLRAEGLSPRAISKVLLLHSHFDHVGVAPYLKRRYPHLTILASQRAWEILAMEKARETINRFSSMVAQKMGGLGAMDGMDWQWREDIQGENLSEGDTIDLGGLHLEIMEVPGHSSCCIAAYCPQLKALFPSDAGGIPFKDDILPMGNSNYTLFQQSLQKMASLEVKILCADHYGYIVGGEAGTYIQRAMVRAGEFRAQMEEVLSEEGDLDAAASRITEAFFQRHPDYILTPEIYAGVVRQMLRHIAQAMDNEGHWGGADPTPEKAET